MYTVTFQDVNGVERISRCFETVKAARNWFRWIQAQKFASSVSLYRGQAGEELLQRSEHRVLPLEAYLAVSA